MRHGWLRHQHRSHTLWHITVYAGAVVVAFLLLKRLAPILTPVFTALGLAYLLEPVTSRLARRLPRPVAAACTLLGFVVILGALLFALTPLVMADFERFWPKLPQLAHHAIVWAEKTLRIRFPATWSDVVAQGAAEIRTITLGAVDRVVSSFALAVGGFFSFLAGLLGVLFVPVFAYYFLVGWPQVLGAVREMTPPRHRALVGRVASEIDAVISTWIHGQLIVAVTEAVLYAVFLSLVGIELAVPIGIITGILSFIPYVGIGVGICLATMMVVLDWQGAGHLVLVWLVFGGMQALESFFLTPRLVGRKVGLGEAGALFAVLAGAELLGLAGMMLAIPIAASVAVILRHVLAAYRDTEFYSWEGSVSSPDEVERKR